MCLRSLGRLQHPRKWVLGGGRKSVNFPPLLFVGFLLGFVGLVDPFRTLDAMRHKASAAFHVGNRSRKFDDFRKIVETNWGSGIF